ncbi:oxidative DNA demethylase, partial [Perkinsus olseni]
AQLRAEQRAAREDLEREAKEREANFKLFEQRTLDRLRLKESELDRRAVATKESLLRELESERVGVRDRSRALAARENELAHWEKKLEVMRRDIQEREDKLRTVRQQFEDLKNKEV